MLVVSALLALPAVTPPQADPIPVRSPKETILSDEVVVMPLNLSMGWPVVEVGIGEHGPYPMILDTGASVTVLPAHLKKELGLTPVGKSRIGDPSNPAAREVDIVELPYLYIGDALFEEVPAVTWEEDMGLSRMGIQGIVGLHVFNDCLITFDYGAKEVRIQKGELPEPDARRVLEFKRGGHITIPLQIDGKTMDAHLDSGNSQHLALPQSWEGKVPLVPGSEFTGSGQRASGRFETRGGRLDSEVRIGGLVLEKPMVSFHSLPYANLGRGFFELGPVTVDQAKGRLLLGGVPEAQEASARRGPAVQRVDESKGRRRLGIEIALRGGEEMRISRVVPDSLAESIGLLAGDVLLSVDGKKLTTSDRSPLSEALAKPDAFRIDVKRGAETVEIQVPAE